MAEKGLKPSGGAVTWLGRQPGRLISLRREQELGPDGEGGVCKVGKKGKGVWGRVRGMCKSEQVIRAL